MPLYMCNSVKGSIPDHLKAAIASDMTDIHSEITGAPAEFVHVFFFEDAPQQPLNGKSVLLFGSIRHGRTPEQKQSLVEQMKQSIHLHAVVPIKNIMVEMTDVPSSWVMEAGAVLPEPGQEAEWIKNMDSLEPGL